ncbi:hypothetical protein D5278_13790 [bacterium 1XD21-13]|nr:hypothetical protein [bacterium 1XD21-13]
MEGMTMVELLKNVVDVGITPVLLVVFIVFFIQRTKDDDTRVKKSNSEAQKAIRDREDMLMAESAKREELIRQEAEKRENLIRKEAEKRESILMANQDRMLNSLDKITDSIAKIEQSLSRMESRHEQDIGQLKGQVQNLENKLTGKGAHDGRTGNLGG